MTQQDISIHAQMSAHRIVLAHLWALALRGRSEGKDDIEVIADAFVQDWKDVLAKVPSSPSEISRHSRESFEQEMGVITKMAVGLLNTMNSASPAHPPSRTAP